MNTVTIGTGQEVPPLMQDWKGVLCTTPPCHTTTEFNSITKMCSPTEDEGGSTITKVQFQHWLAREGVERCWSKDDFNEDKQPSPADPCPKMSTKSRCPKVDLWWKAQGWGPSITMGEYTNIESFIFVNFTSVALAGTEVNMPGGNIDWQEFTNGFNYNQKRVECKDQEWFEDHAEEYYSFTEHPEFSFLNTEAQNNKACLRQNAEKAFDRFQERLEGIAKDIEDFNDGKSEEHFRERARHQNGPKAEMLLVSMGNMQTRDKSYNGMNPRVMASSVSI